MNYNVELIWDNEANVWIATSADIIGLALESGSLDALMERVKFAVPELLTLNKQKFDENTTLVFRSERFEAMVI